MKVDAEFVTWTYRVLLGREPENDAVIQLHVGTNMERGEYVTHVLRSPEFLFNHPETAGVSRAWVWADLADFLLRVNLYDMHVSRLAIEGSMEPAETHFVRSMLKRGDVAIDIGANLGYYTMLFGCIVGSSGRVYSFEPVPTLFESLMRSVNRNGFESHVSAFNAALGDEVRRQPFLVATDTSNWGGGGFLAGRDIPKGHEAFEVLSAPLKHFCNPDRIDFVKIDVEGAEPLVIRGCAEQLRQFKPIVLSEVHVPQLKSVSNCSASEYIGLFESLGYTAYGLTGEGVIGEQATAETLPEVSNVVFVPETGVAARIHG